MMLHCYWIIHKGEEEGLYMKVVEGSDPPDKSYYVTQNIVGSLGALVDIGSNPDLKRD